MSRVMVLEAMLESERRYRDAMWAEAQRCAAWGGQSHSDRLREHDRAAASCRRLSDQLSDAYRDEAMERIGLAVAG